MIIKLFFKEYEANVTFGACREFYEKTGLDLKLTLDLALNAYATNQQDQLIERAIGWHGVIGDVVGADLLHCVLRETDGSRVQLEEIEDAMYNAGRSIIETAGEWSMPWFFSIVKIAENERSSHTEKVKKKRQQSSLDSLDR